jgi:hypothetical protein
VTRAVLTCSACGVEGEHELRYAGRLLHSTHCQACGHEVRHEPHDLRVAYAHDLAHRVATKPGRLARRARRQPASFWLTLPAAVLRQPRKLAGELRTLFRD